MSSQRLRQNQDSAAQAVNVRHTRERSCSTDSIVTLSLYTDTMLTIPSAYPYPAIPVGDRTTQKGRIK